MWVEDEALEEDTSVDDDKTIVEEDEENALVVDDEEDTIVDEDEDDVVVKDEVDVADFKEAVDDVNVIAGVLELELEEPQLPYEDRHPVPQ